jgi:ferredoxin-NADP reductase
VARTALRRRLTWQVATVAAVAQETASVRTIALELPDWPGHLAGQHLDVRLTAEDGYSAERSYSIASAPGEAPAITVERLYDGEVSPYLTEELRAGDQIEVRGPIGGYFVWDSGDNANQPLLLIAGGSGIVPLRSILRHRDLSGSAVAARLLYSARALAEVIYRTELDRYDDGVEVIYTLTRQRPPAWTGHTGRVDDALLAEVAWPAGRQPLAFVCGPTRFVETVAAGLVRLGYPPAQVKTERFGGSAGRGDDPPSPAQAGRGDDPPSPAQAGGR